MSSESFSFEDARKPVQQSTASGQPATFSFEEATGKPTDGPLARGWNKTKQSATITGRLAAGDAAGAAQTIKEADDYARRNPGMAEGRDLSAAWQRGDGVLGGISEVAGEFAKDWREAPGVIGGIRATGRNLRAMGEGIVEQTPNMIAPTVGMLTGGAAGGAAGSAVPLVGNAAGAIAGGWLGATAGNTLVEGGGMTQEAIQKAGINPQDTAAVERYLKANGDNILGQAGVKGGIIGAVDVATMGIAGKILNGPARAATSRALADLGVDATNKAAVSAAMKTPEFAAKLAGDAAYQASMKGAGNVARNVGAAALDPAGEFVGEFAGQGVATGDWDTKNAALEALSSIGQSGIMFAGQKAYQAATRPKSGTQTGAQADADPTTSPGAADPNAPAPQPAAAPEAPNFETSLGAGIPRQDGGFDFTRDIDTSGLSLADPADTIASRLKPSELMGLNPAAGALSREVAAFVDATPFTEVTPIEQRAGIGAHRRLGERPIIDVEAREIVEPGATIAGRLSGPSPSSPIQAAAQQAVTNVAASPRLPYNQSQQGDTFANEATQAQQAAAQRAQTGAAQAGPALIETPQQAWDSYSAEQRAAVARSAGVRGAMSRSVAAKGWGDLSPNLRASIAASIQPSGLPWGSSNVGNVSTPQPFTVSGREGSGDLLAPGQRGVGLSGNGDGVRGGSDGARSGVAGAGVGEAGLAPVAGRAGTAPALTQGVAPNATKAGQAQVAAPGQAAADPRFAGQAAAGAQAGGVSAPRPAGVEANGLTPESVAITSARIARREDSRSSDPRTDRILAQENYLRDLALNQPEEARRVAREMRGNSGAMSDAAGVSPDMIGRYASIIERSLPADTNAQPQNAEAGQQYVAQPQGAARATPARKKTRQHPPTVRGSGALAEVSRALGGISPDLLADLSEKVVRNRTSKTGKKTQYTSWDNPAIPGVGPLFRKGGTGDIAEVARVLEEAGYLEAGANERDPIGAAQRAQEIIRGELRKGGSATQVGNADAIDAEMRARLNAEMEAAMDAESDPWDDFSFTPDDLDESGYADLNPELQSEVERLIAEADQAGIDTETIREDVARQVGEEASQDEYNAAVKEAIQGILPRAGRATEQAQPSRPQQGDRDGIEAAGDPSQEGSRGRGRQGGSDREALTLEAQTEEDLRAKAEREDAATSEAAAAKAAEQERLRREAEDRDNKARADATVDDFQLGQTAEQQMSGMDDLFGMSAPESEQSQPQSSRSANSDAQLADAIDAIGDSLKRSLADAAAKARATAEDWASRQYRKSGRSVTFEGDGPSRSESVSVDGANAARRDDVVRTSNALGDAAQSLVESLDRKGARAFLSEMLSLHTGSDAAFESTLISRLGLDGVARKGAMTSTDATKAVLSAVKQYREAIRNADSAEGRPDWMDELFGTDSEAQQEQDAEVSAPTKPAPTESPKDATLEEIFDGLQSRGLKKKNATEAAKAHPLAERITLVDKHILDILSDLDDSGTIKINC